jgi:3-hydroxybutyryl-CoA dehydrogenase
VTTRTASELRTITVIGAGTMGAGIAHVAAAAGHTVQWFDAVAGAAATGLGRIEKNLAKASPQNRGMERPACLTDRL